MSENPPEAQQKGQRLAQQRWGRGTIQSDGQNTQGNTGDEYEKDASSDNEKPSGDLQPNDTDSQIEPEQEKHCANVELIAIDDVSRKEGMTSHVQFCTHSEGQNAQINTKQSNEAQTEMSVPAKIQNVPEDIIENHTEVLNGDTEAVQGENSPQSIPTAQSRLGGQDSREFEGNESTMIRSNQHAGPEHECEELPTDKTTAEMDKEYEQNYNE